MELSKKAQRAVEVLAQGGRYEHRLERNGYTGREQWEYRLRIGSNTVKGYGMATFHELEKAGLLKYHPDMSVSSRYTLREVAQ